MKKKLIIVVLIALIIVVPACRNKETSAIELITGQYFDWNTQSNSVFVIDERLYHAVDIHAIAREDLETSIVVSEEVHIITDSEGRWCVEYGRANNDLPFILLRCEKLGLYLLVPYRAQRYLFDFDPARPLGYCLEPLDKS